MYTILKDDHLFVFRSINLMERTIRDGRHFTYLCSADFAFKMEREAYIPNIYWTVIKDRGAIFDPGEIPDLIEALKKVEKYLRSREELI